MRTTIKLMFVTITLLTISACKGPEVYVACQAGVGAVQCQVQHTAGSQPANVCWDVKFSCVNGTFLKARTCQDVAAKATISHAIPDAKFGDINKCDNIVSTAVENVVVKAL